MNTATTTSSIRETSTSSSSFARSPSQPAFSSLGNHATSTSSKLKLHTPDVHGQRMKLRKLPLKTSSSFSSSVQRLEAGTSSFGSLLADNPPVLPDRSPEPTSSKRPVRVRSSVFRAAEGGSQTILPVVTKSPLRARARSTNSAAAAAKTTMKRSFSSDGVVVTSDQLRSSAKSLRSRRKSGRVVTESSNGVGLNDSASHLSDDNASLPLYELDEPHLDDEDDHRTPKPPIYTDDVVENGHNGDDDDELISLGANKKKSRPPTTFFSQLNQPPGGSVVLPTQLWLHMKPPQFLTLMLLLAITCFVASSYRQVLAATDEIEQVRLGESKLLVHLHKVEQNALELAETMKRLNDRHDGAAAVVASSEPQAPPQQQQQQGSVDGDLIRVQIEKLRDLEAELDHEVRTLRKNIQQTARYEIVQHYGEGGVQVFLEMETIGGDAPASKQVLSVRLWYDTPHTGWTFLQQVNAGTWEGAIWSIQQGRSLVATPALAAGVSRLEPTLDFLEPSERGHEKYTVTLTDATLSINLQDNRQHHRQEACVGVIFEGFDVLHNMVRDSSRTAQTVRIKRATASHITRADAGGLV